jgi:hypothetical protein
MSSGKRMISFCLDKEDDKDIIAWLEEQRNQSQTIRDALRLAIAPPSALDIAAIRAVVEAALDERLAHLVMVNGEPPGATEEDPELGAALDEMF